MIFKLSFFCAFSFLLMLCACSEPVVLQEECSRGPELPDLEILDIFISDGEPDHFKATFINRGKTATESAQFLISFSCESGNYLGNPSYRYDVPESDQVGSTNNLPFSVLSMTPNDPAVIKAEIDWEGRVDEIDECNNSFQVSFN